MMAVMRSIALALCLATAACGSLPRMDDLFAREERPPPLAIAATARAVEEPTLRIAQGRRQAMAVLVQQNGEMRLWRSPEGLVVATDGARVVATAGLPLWLAASRIDGEDPLDNPEAIIGRTVPMRRSVDLMRRNRSPEDMRFGVALDCRLRARRTGESILVEEGCAGGGHRFVNRYWAEGENGAVWRSEQWVGDDDEPMKVEVLAPPPG